MPDTVSPGTPPGKAKSTLLAIAAALEAQAAAIRAQAEAEPESDPWLDLESAAEQFHISPNTLRTWARTGKLRSCSAERGRIIFRASWLESALESSAYQPRPEIVKVAADASMAEWDIKADRALGGGH